MKYLLFVCLLDVSVGGMGRKSCKTKGNKLSYRLDSQFLIPTHPSDAADISISKRAIIMRRTIDNCTVGSSNQ